MKKIIFLIAFLQLSVCFAQRPIGGRGSGTNIDKTSKRKEMPKFEAAKAAGILVFESKKILKKLKLKKNDSISELLNTHVDNYNKEIENIKITNKDLFEGLDLVVNQNMEAAVSNKNRKVMHETRRMIKEKLDPIRVEVQTHQDKLNALLEPIFTEAQNTKWLSYQKSEKEKLTPKRPNRSNAKNRPNNGYRQQGRRSGN